MLDITLNQVVEHYAPELIAQTRAFEKDMAMDPFLNAINTHWGVTQNRDHLTHMRMENPDTGKFLAHNILFRELLSSESTFNQDRFIAFTTNLLEKALELRNSPNNRTIYGLYKSESFMHDIAIQTNMDEKDLRYLISALRANAVLATQTNPDLMDNFFKCQIAYIQDYKQLPPTIQKKDLSQSSNIAQWYDNNSQGRRGIGSFFPYEIEFLLQATNSDTRGVLELTKFYMQSFIHQTTSNEEIAKNIRETTGVGINSTTLAIYLDYISMDFPKEFIDVKTLK